MKTQKQFTPQQYNFAPDQLVRIVRVQAGELNDVEWRRAKSVDPVVWKSVTPDMLDTCRGTMYVHVEAVHTYRIENTISGVVLGDYEGASPADALDLMAREAGCANYAALCEEVPARPGEISVTLVECIDRQECLDAEDEDDARYIVTSRATSASCSVVELADGGLALEMDSDCNRPIAQFADKSEAERVRARFAEEAPLADLIVAQMGVDVSDADDEESK